MTPNQIEMQKALTQKYHTAPKLIEDKKSKEMRPVRMLGRPPVGLFKKRQQNNAAP